MKIVLGLIILFLYLIYDLHMYKNRKFNCNHQLWALCYKPEGRWFDPSWCHWIFH